jgi:hypothetical protein
MKMRRKWYTTGVEFEDHSFGMERHPHSRKKDGMGEKDLS